MRIIKKTVGYLIEVFIIAILLILFLPSRTPEIDGEKSVAVLQQIKLGRVNQYILVRGKSYSAAISESSMNREQFVEDTIELIDYLCEKYHKEKVYLVGHSWGSVSTGIFILEHCKKEK